MKLLSLIRSEKLKIRHTPFKAIHIIIPLMGAFLFIIYYILYSNVNDFQKLNLILEITATIFPLLISIVVGLNIALEEKNCHFQLLLAVPNRKKILFSKVIVLYGTGVTALFFVFFIFMVGINLSGWAGAVTPLLLLQAVIGIACTSLVIYILHLFLSLKFGMEISLFWGVFESLQCILYSNIRLRGIWRYIPFAWSINWIQDVFDGKLSKHQTEWLMIAVLSFLTLFLLLTWFSHWEGRKNYE